MSTLISKTSKLLKLQVMHKYIGNKSSKAHTQEYSSVFNSLKLPSGHEIVKKINTKENKVYFSALKMNKKVVENDFNISFSKIRDDLLRFDSGGVQLIKEDKTGLAIVKISNSERKNALSGKMIVELWDILNELEQWKNGKAVIFHSTGDCFCSGMDLTMIREKCDQFGGYEMSTYLQQTCSKLEALPLVTVALIQGHAMGGGAEFITSFDFRLFGPKAEARFVHSRMGVSTGIAGGGSRLVRLVGSSQALKLLLTGEKILAQKALEIGLASAVLESDENLMEQGVEWLKPLITDRETNIVQSIKQIVYHASNLPLAQALEVEKDIFVSAWGGPTLLQSLKEGKKHK